MTVLTSSRVLWVLAVAAGLLTAYSILGYAMAGSFIVASGHRQPYITAATVWGIIALVSGVLAVGFATAAWRRRRVK